MGALDDAIREHLELKRQHGAAEDEIRRAEAEALGPARREPASDLAGDEDPFEGDAGAYEDAALPPPAAESAVHDAPPPPPGLGEDPGTEPPPEPVEDYPYMDPLLVDAKAEPGLADREPHPDDEPVADFAPDEDHPDDPDRTRTAILDDPLDELAPLDGAPPIHHEPGPDEPPAPARPIAPEPPEHEPTAAFQPPAPAPAPSADPDEDVLEETPDFLQETPEHDRLWFEQKPPRDFDFDD